MTLVNLVYRRPDGVHAEGTLLTAADGSVAVSSIHRYDTSDGEMTRVAFTVPLGTQGVFFDPGTWVFELVGVSDGKGGYLTGDDATSVRIVPASGTFDVDDLTETTLSGGPALPDELTARVAALEALIAGGGGGGGGAVLSVAGKTGAVNLVIADISNTNDVGQAIVTMAGASLAARKAAVLAYLGAGTSGLTLGTSSTQAAQGDLAAYLAGAQTFTGTKTFSAGLTVSGGTVNLPDNSLAIADVSGLQAALDTLTAAVAAINTALNDTPQFVYVSSGAYPARRATPRPQIFRDPTVIPTNDGSTSGGGGMVPNIDIWLGN